MDGSLEYISHLKVSVKYQMFKSIDPNTDRNN